LDDVIHIAEFSGVEGTGEDCGGERKAKPQSEQVFSHSVHGVILAQSGNHQKQDGKTADLPPKPWSFSFFGLIRFD
jgi:hypothetical protein